MRFENHFDLHLRSAHFPHERDNSERKTDILGGSVLHQLVLAIRRDERNAAFAFEFAEFHLDSALAFGTYLQPIG